MTVNYIHQNHQLQNHANYRLFIADYVVLVLLIVEGENKILKLRYNEKLLIFGSRMLMFHILLKAMIVLEPLGTEFSCCIEDPLVAFNCCLLFGRDVVCLTYSPFLFSILSYTYTRNVWTNCTNSDLDITSWLKRTKHRKKFSYTSGYFSALRTYNKTVITYNHWIIGSLEITD